MFSHAGPGMAPRAARIEARRRMVPAMLSPASPLAAPFISLLARASKDMPPSHAPVARNTLERRIAATGLRRGSSDWAAAQDTRSTASANRSR